MLRWRRRRDEGAGSTGGGLQSSVLRPARQAPVNTSGDKPRERVLARRPGRGLAGLERVELEHGKGERRIGGSAGRRVDKGVPQHKAEGPTWALAHSLLPSSQPALSPASAAMARPPPPPWPDRLELCAPGMPEQHLRSMRLVVAQAVRRLTRHEETYWEALGGARSGRVPGVFHRHHRALRCWATRSARRAWWLGQCVLGAWARGKRPGDLNAGLELADALVLRRRATRSAVLAQVPELVWQVLGQTQQLFVLASRAPAATDSAVGVADLYLRALAAPQHVVGDTFF